MSVDAPRRAHRLAPPRGGGRATRPERERSERRRSADCRARAAAGGGGLDPTQAQFGNAQVARVRPVRERWVNRLPVVALLGMTLLSGAAARPGRTPVCLLA